MAKLLTTIFLALVHSTVAETDRPIIGVLTTPLLNGGCVTFQSMLPATAPVPTSCFHNLYVKWLEMAGARVVPIPFDLPLESITELASSLNGILFTGGDTPITDLQCPYMQAAGHLLNLTKEAHKAGEYLPLWGTCMGIQTLSILVAGDASVLESGIFEGVDPKMMALDLTKDADSSRMLGVNCAPSDIRKMVSTLPVTTNLHHDGVAPATFSSNQRLSAFFRVISTNKDDDGHPFVSTIEAKNMPVYGVQWHPERPQFEWRATPDPINHSKEAIASMQYFADFFIDEARKNNRRFPSPQEESNSLIYNYQSVGTDSYQPYFFSTSIE